MQLLQSVKWQSILLLIISFKLFAGAFEIEHTVLVLIFRPHLIKRVLRA